MPQPATAGIVAGCIVVVAGSLLVGHRLYQRIREWRYRRSRSSESEEDLPPIQEQPRTYFGPGSAADPRPSTTPYGGQGPVEPQSQGGDAMRYEPSRPPSLFATARSSLQVTRNSFLDNSSAQISSPISFDTRTADLHASVCSRFPMSRPLSMIDSGAGLPCTRRSSMESPTEMAHARTRHDSLPRNPSRLSHLSYMSSSSSTRTRQRSYAGSTYTRSSLGGLLPNVATSPLSMYSSGGAYPQHRRRSSYLPHLPQNRDDVQIIPPQPLGIGFGGLAMAKDQRTLAFSEQSGVGLGEDVFGGHELAALAWAQAEQEKEATVAASQMTRERERYLQEGQALIQRQRQGQQSVESSGILPSVPAPAHGPLPVPRRILSTELSA